MNRWDEIQGLARDIASNVHADPAKRDAMADDLIKLCGAMIGAVGKVVACEGEAAIGDGDDASAHTRYLVGERVRDAAREAVDSATNPKVDLDRWTRPSPGDWCRCGHAPSVHEDGVCNGEGFNGVACHGGPCRGFVRKEPTGGWRHIDRRPAALQPSATPGAPIELGNPEPVNLDGFGATPFPAFHGTAVAPRRCCYAASGPCATCRNGRPVGRCCYPLRDVCPSHH
ncbi:hypothetical protein SEA_ABT2GRADUATEX2_53 [Streptomyces phage Abt2graduatex2]|nr:hypothetical protein SEA_ABT2GRADUATEX2_53 [Streptomyces phage Abt2graduatex2]